MIRKLVCAVAVMVVAVGFVMAEEFTANITKVDGDSVTFRKAKGKAAKGKAPEYEDAVTLPAKGAKINAGTAKKGKVEVGDKLEPADFAKQVKDSGDKGVNARITTDADGKKITDIVVTSKKKAAAE